jgi:hypothetical protein
MGRRELNPQDGRTAKLLGKLVNNALNRQAAGQVERRQDGMAVTWRVREGSGDVAATRPRAAKVHRRAAAGDQHDDRVELLTVAVPTVILFPGRLPSVADQIGAGDAMMMPSFAPASASEIRLGLVCAGVIVGILDRVVDPPGVEPGMQGIPRRRLIRMHRRSPIDPGFDKAECRIFTGKHRRDRAAQAGPG